MKIVSGILRLFCAVVVCGTFSALWAQSNSIVDQALDQKSISFQNAAYLVCSATELVPEDASPDDAVAYVQAQKWKFPARKAEAGLNAGDFSYLVMRAFGFKGGIFYTIAPGPRYALRELIFMKLMDSSKAPDSSISGEEAIRIIQKAVDYKR